MENPSSKILRKLQIRDAPFMLEWMREPDILDCFQFDAVDMSEDACREFISSSFDDHCRHYAIVDHTDEYQGTVSLKHIDRKNGIAEYAIVLRRAAMGKGLGKQATLEILDIAYSELKLRKVYLNVFADNTRAKNLYKRCGFVYEGTSKAHIVKDGIPKDLDWYAHFNPDACHIA